MCDVELQPVGICPGRAVVGIDCRRCSELSNGKVIAKRTLVAGRMKLDYLQLLELEVFTRFGSRLEASMEDKIKRRRILREIFKQERLVPATPEFQFAWMRAYHEGMFNSVEARATGHVLRQFKEVVEQSSLTLADSRQRWCDLILPMRETPLVH